MLFVTYYLIKNSLSFKTPPRVDKMLALPFNSVLLYSLILNTALVTDPPWVSGTLNRYPASLYLPAVPCKSSVASSFIFTFFLIL